MAKFKETKRAAVGKTQGIPRGRHLANCKEFQKGRICGNSRNSNSAALGKIQRIPKVRHLAKITEFQMGGIWQNSIGRHLAKFKEFQEGGIWQTVGLRISSKQLVLGVLSGFGAATLVADTVEKKQQRTECFPPPATGQRSHHGQVLVTLDGVRCLFRLCQFLESCFHELQPVFPTCSIVFYGGGWGLGPGLSGDLFGLELNWGNKSPADCARSPGCSPGASQKRCGRCLGWVEAPS